MSRRMDIARAYEAALFAGRMDEVGSYFTDDITYWVAGRPPIGGSWKGRDAVISAFTNREFGLGAADWEHETGERVWYDADDRVVIEIREKSWLKSDPADTIDQRTCVVIRFRREQICEMRDYTDSQRYEEFLAKHRQELPKFSGGAAATR